MAMYPSADDIRQRQQVLALNSSNTILQSRDLAHDDRSLSQNQQDLLLTALNFQAGNAVSSRSQPDIGAVGQDSKSISMNHDGGGLFMSPQQAELDQFGGDYTPDLDYLDGDGFDFENADLGGEMIGALPGGHGDLHEKRKNTDEDEDDAGDSKRQETQEGEKGAKKPGRKPLTSEPTTVCTCLRGL